MLCCVVLFLQSHLLEVEKFTELKLAAVKALQVAHPARAIVIGAMQLAIFRDAQNSTALTSIEGRLIILPCAVNGRVGWLERRHRLYSMQKEINELLGEVINAARVICNIF